MTVFRRVLVAGVLTASMACGGASTSPPPGPAPSTDVSTGTVAIAAGDFAVAAFTLDTRSPLQMRLDWSVMANDLDGFLIRGSCTRDDMLSAKPACTMDAALVGAGTGTARPEVFTTAALDAGPYTLLIVNRGGGNDTCTFRVTKTG